MTPIVRSPLPRIVACSLILFSLFAGLGANAGTVTPNSPSAGLTRYQENFDGLPTGSAPADSWYTLGLLGTGGVSQVSTAPAGLSVKAWQVTDAGTPFVARLRNNAANVNLCTTGQSLTFDAEVPDLTTSDVRELRVSPGATGISNAAAPANSFGLRITGILGGTNSANFFARGNTGAVQLSATGVQTPATPVHIQAAQVNCGTTGCTVFTFTGLTGLASPLTQCAAGGDPFVGIMNAVAVVDTASVAAATVWVDNYEWQGATSPGGPAPTPTIIDVGPHCGPIEGGQALKIFGSNFLPGATAAIGGIPGSGTIVRNSSQINTTTPPNGSGTYDVTVTNPGGVTATKTLAYKYGDCRPTIPGDTVPGPQGYFDNFDAIPAGTHPSQTWYTSTASISTGTEQRVSLPNSAVAIAAADYTLTGTLTLCTLGDVSADVRKTSGTVGLGAYTTGNTDRLELAWAPGSQFHAILFNGGMIRQEGFFGQPATAATWYHFSISNIVCSPTEFAATFSVAGQGALRLSTSFPATGLMQRIATTEYTDNLCVQCGNTGPIVADGTIPGTFKGFDVDPLGLTPIVRKTTTSPTFEGVQVFTGDLTAGPTESTECNRLDGVSSMFSGRTHNTLVAFVKCAAGFFTIEIRAGNLGPPNFPDTCNDSSNENDQYCKSFIPDCGESETVCVGESGADGTDRITDTVEISTLDIFPYDYTSYASANRDTTISIAASTTDGELAIYAMHYSDENDFEGSQDILGFATQLIDVTGIKQICTTRTGQNLQTDFDAVYAMGNSQARGYALSYESLLYFFTPLNSEPFALPIFGRSLLAGSTIATNPTALGCGASRVVVAQTSGQVGVLDVGNNQQWRMNTTTAIVPTRGLTMDPSGRYIAYVKDSRIVLQTVPKAATQTPPRPRAYLAFPSGEAIVNLQFDNQAHRLWLATATSVRYWDVAQYFGTESISNNPDMDSDNDGVPNEQDYDIDDDGFCNGPASQPAGTPGTEANNGCAGFTSANCSTTNPCPGPPDPGCANTPEGCSTPPPCTTGSCNIPPVCQNYGDPDKDNDGQPDCGDVDGDGIEDSEDPDIDGDGSPNDGDVDGDGIEDSEDPDIDGDGIPNESDPDIDGDGIPNDEDPFPEGADDDDDGDGIPDNQDPHPDGADNDDDGDGLPDNDDPAPGGGGTGGGGGGGNGGNQGNGGGTAPPQGGLADGGSFLGQDTTGLATAMGVSQQAANFFLGILMMLAIGGGFYFINQRAFMAGIGSSVGFLLAFAFGLIPLWAVLVLVLIGAAVVVVKFQGGGSVGS